ncbi:hypothetical protein N0B35_07345 [Lactiplantibacillus plantarum]|nr:hypothetical protein [Lactiplantibacillus plantarum]
MKWCYKIFQITVLTIAAALLGWMIVANWQVNLKLHLAISAWIGAGLFVLFIGATIGLGSWWLSRHQTSWLVAALMGLTILKFPLVAGLKIDPTSDFWNYHTLAAFSAQGFTWTQLVTPWYRWQLRRFSARFKYRERLQFSRSFWRGQLFCQPTNQYWVYFSRYGLNLLASRTVALTTIRHHGCPHFLLDSSLLAVRHALKW